MFPGISVLLIGISSATNGCAPNAGGLVAIPSPYGSGSLMVPCPEGPKLPPTPSPSMSLGIEHYHESFKKNWHWDIRPDGPNPDRYNDLIRSETVSTCGLEYVECSGSLMPGTTQSEARGISGQLLRRRPSGVSKSMANSPSYLAVPTPMTRSAAESHCARFGGYLPSIHSSEENNLIYDMCKSMFQFSSIPKSEATLEMINEAKESGNYDTKEMCWIGLKRSNDTRSWDDGSASDYSPYLFGPPPNLFGSYDKSTRCGSISQKIIWYGPSSPIPRKRVVMWYYDADCETKELPFICKIPQAPRMPPPNFQTSPALIRLQGGPIGQETFQPLMN